MAAHRTVSRRALEGFTTGALDMYDEMIAAGFVDHVPQNPFAAALHGPQLMRSAVVPYRSAFPDLVLTVEEQHGDDEVVSSRFKATGTQTGGLLGLPPAGRQMTIGGVQIDRFDGDKIAESWRYWETLGMLQQLGAVPTPPAASTVYRPRYRVNAGSRPARSTPVAFVGTPGHYGACCSATQANAGMRRRCARGWRPRRASRVVTRRP